MKSLEERLRELLGVSVSSRWPESSSGTWSSEIFKLILKVSENIVVTIVAINVGFISGKEEILSTDEAQFLNCVSLLCEVMIVVSTKIFFFNKQNPGV